MGRHRILVAGLVGVWVCSAGMPTAGAAMEAASIMRQAEGEIVWLDIPIGKLELVVQHPEGTREIVEYTMTPHETSVTDQSDKQFLRLEDLRAGQHVILESKDQGAQRIATKITVESTAAPMFQLAEGTIESIDAREGTFVLKETTTPGIAGPGSVFAFDSKEIVVMESPSLRPVRLEVKQGDFVRVYYVVIDGRRYARSLMRYATAPPQTSTTTATTTSTTTTTQ